MKKERLGRNLVLDYMNGAALACTIRLVPPSLNTVAATMLNIYNAFLQRPRVNAQACDEFVRK